MPQHDRGFHRRHFRRGGNRLDRCSLARIIETGPEKKGGGGKEIGGDKKTCRKTKTFCKKSLEEKIAGELYEQYALRAASGGPFHDADECCHPLLFPLTCVHDTAGRTA